MPISSAVGLIPDTKEIYPSWSPDGQKILFISYGPMSQGIFVVKPDGSDLQKITSDGWSPSWNPDGTNILVQKHFFDDGDRENGSYEIALLNLKTLNITRLTYHGNSETESRPKFSPDGKQIVFESANAIHIMNSDGTELKKLVDSAASPEFSPNSKRIAYYTFEDLIEIWIINTDGTNKKKIFIDYKYLIGGRYRWTTDSKYLLLNNRSDIITKVNVENTSDIEYIYDPVAHWDPEYSPDGNFITFISNMDGGDYDLFVARSNGSDLYRIVFDTNPKLINASPDYFEKKTRPTPPPWPTPSPTSVRSPTTTPTSTGTAVTTAEVPGFSLLAGISSLIISVLMKRMKR